MSSPSMLSASRAYATTTTTTTTRSRQRAPQTTRRATRTTRAMASASELQGKENKDVRVLVVGATGYIGKYVTRELCARGYDVTAFTREQSGIGGKTAKDGAIAMFPDATVKFGSVGDKASIANEAFGSEGFDVVVSCLASRTGGIKDSWDIDYQATKNVLDVARERGTKHFVLLSAICVQKPLLTFQKAKLKFEEELQNAGDISYSIIRPTAFFKSLAGQVEVVQKGGPYVMFGDGQLASCKPISESDLAKFMADSIREPEMMNKVLPIGGPGEAMSALQQGTMLFELLEMEPKFVKVPIEVMDVVIKVLDVFAGFFANMKDAAEFGKIGRYYAAESMLVMKDEKYNADATPSYGTDTLKEFFARVAKDGLAGQELGDQAVFK